jgi:hypothetical protein
MMLKYLRVDWMCCRESVRKELVGSIGEKAYALWRDKMARLMLQEGVVYHGMVMTWTFRHLLPLVLNVVSCNVN